MEGLEKILEEFGAYICNDLCYYREVNVEKNDGEMEEICARCKAGEYLKSIRQHINGDWIPVDERLSKVTEEDITPVEVTTRGGWITVGCYFEYMDEWYTLDGASKLDVIAWEEPSEPYRPERKI